MKKSSKLCLILNLSCCTCILLIVGSIVAMYMFGLQASKPDPGFCTRKHAAQAMECAKVSSESDGLPVDCHFQKDDELGAAAASLNHTQLLLRQSKDYEPLAGLCHVTLVSSNQRPLNFVINRNVPVKSNVEPSATSWTTSASADSSTTTRKNSPIAPTDSTRKGTKSSVWETFSTRRNELVHRDFLCFSIYSFQSAKEACTEWKSITPCVKQAIRNECDDKLGILQFKWEEVEVLMEDVHNSVILCRKPRGPTAFIAKKTARSLSDRTRASITEPWRSFWTVYRSLSHWPVLDMNIVKFV